MTCGKSQESYHQLLLYQALRCVFVALFKDQRGKLAAVAGEFREEFVDDPAGVEGVVLDAQQILSDLVHVAHLAQSHRRVVGEVALLGADVLLDLVAVFLRVQVGESAAGVALVVDVALVEHLHIHRDRVDLRVDALDQRFLRRVVAAEGGAVVLSDRLYSQVSATSPSAVPAESTHTRPESPAP